MPFHFGAATHIGNVRKANEDQYMIARLSKVFELIGSSLPEQELTGMEAQQAYLLVVSDGMGGALAGEQASSMVLQEVKTYMIQTAKWFIRWNEEEEAVTEGVKDVQKGLEQIDQAILDAARKDDSLTGMGATLTIARLIGKDLLIIHVGDSRGYLFRNDRLQLLTHDHTFAQMLVDTGALTPEQARHHKMRNILVNVLGGKEAGVKPEIHQTILNRGDRLLLCTDGLTSPVEAAKIENVLRSYADPQQACDALIEAALNAGAPDNITALLADYS